MLTSVCIGCSANMSPASNAWALYLLLLGSRHSWGCCCHMISCLQSPWLHGLPVPLQALLLLLRCVRPSASGSEAGLQLSSSTPNRCWQSPNTSMLATACMATHNTWKGNGCSPARQTHSLECCKYSILAYKHLSVRLNTRQAPNSTVGCSTLQAGPSSAKHHTSCPPEAPSEATHYHHDAMPHHQASQGLPHPAAAAGLLAALAAAE